MSEHVISEPGRRYPPLAAPRLPAWTVWLLPKPFDAVSSLLYVGVLALYFYERALALYGHGLEWLPSTLITGAVLLLLALDRAEYWFYGPVTPPTRLAAVLLAARILLIGLVAQLDDFSFSPFLYLMIPFTASLYFGTAVSYWVAGLVWITFVVKFSAYQADWYTTQAGIHAALIFTLGLVFAIAMAKIVDNEKASRARAEGLLAELETSHRQLRAYAEQVEELAAAKERNRLARDIHDSLGHYLTVINVQLEKALAFRESRPAEAHRAVEDAKGLAREALQDVRRSVSVLRAVVEAEPFALGEALTALVDHMRGGLFTIDLRIEGSEAGFPNDTLLSLYRAAQEGLTNIQKHAGAGAVEVTLILGAEGAELTLHDDGRGFARPAPASPAPGAEGGYGLQGVQERLALVGGRLRMESRPGAGTWLRAEAPKDRRDPAPPSSDRETGHGR